MTRSCLLISLCIENIVMYLSVMSKMRNKNSKRYLMHWEKEVKLKVKKSSL